MKYPIRLLLIPVFAILLFTSCNQDPGPYGGKWHCYGIFPISDPVIVVHPEFHNNGTVTLTPAASSLPAQTFNFSYANDSLFIDDGSMIHKYKTYFPHPDTMQWTPDTTSWIGLVPTYYFYRI